MYVRLATIAFFLFATTNLLSAQSEQTDFLRQTGMIYVVVAVMAIVFLGITIYLFYIDRKLTKLENQISDHDQNG